MQLSPEQARDEPKWWYDPRYIITELNVNRFVSRTRSLSMTLMYTWLLRLKCDCASSAWRDSRPPSI